MKISLRLKILVMSFFMVSISIVTSGWIMVYGITDSFEEELGERAVAIARTVAQMPDIRNNVGELNGSKIIQPIAERTRLATNVNYIVIIDMNRIRYSHPSESLIGKMFVGGDEFAALAEHEYTSEAQGTLGKAVRAFVPIMDEEGIKQVGVAVVGVLTPTFQAMITQYSNDLLLLLIWGLLLGLIGSFLLANNVKKQTFGLEPYEIARLAEERSAVMQAMDMGIIALDEQGYVTFMNRLAKKYTYQEEETKELHLRDISLKTWEAIVNQLKTSGEQQLINRNAVLFEKIYLLSFYHTHVKGKLVGSFITMVERTEANRFAEELTGVKALVDALRAQNHEYMNKLHSIAGLIQLDRTEEALDLIIDETVDEENVIQFLKEQLSDYSVSGLLLGKRSRARELGITFYIDRNSYLKEILNGFSCGDMVTILGNLLENAFEAFNRDQESKVVECLIQGNADFLYIRVRDEGKGITIDQQEKIFTHGYSTKGKEGRGIGLALVNQIVTAQQGEITVESEVGEGTEITIEVNRGEK
ncbi:ATP-binding protein [Salipaludibacillus neizhouensis]|nr:sensor histidine kinase [Salipaludibacillus neizhouensis]